MTHSNNGLIALTSNTQAPSSKVERSLVPLNYQIVRSKRKTMVVHVQHECVEVRAPAFVTDAQIQEFVSKHTQWITRKLAEKAQHNAQRLSLQDGGKIFFKGKSLHIRIFQCKLEAVKTTETEFHIYAKRTDEKTVNAVVQRWLIAQAKAILPGRTRALAEHLKAGSKLKEVVFRKTKTKWGHCTSAGRIQFNWLIMLAPDAIIDYMICHEVSHLLVMNHSAKFWSLVESVCPEYRAYVRWLRKHEHRLWL
ncbi:MAG: M48 family metallopeptidase [Gammaproteobacteria bacterium]